MSTQNCPRCDAVLRDPNGNFCGQCGAKIVRETPIPEPIAVSVSETPSNASGPSITAILLIVIGIVVLGYTAFVLPDTESRKGYPSHTPSVAKKAKKSRSVKTNRVTVGGSSVESDTPEDFDFYHQEFDCPSQNAVQQFRSQAIKVDEIIRSGPSGLSLKEEQELGRETLETIEQAIGGTLTQEGEIASYIATVGHSLTFDLKRPDISYEFYLLEDTEMINALALPAGHIIVTRPMFEQWVTNEAKLATILGHEIAHVDNKHVIAAYEFAKYLDPSATKNELMLLLIQLLSRGLYSVEREAESDAYGAGKIHSLGYSTFQSVELWESQIKNVDREEQEPDQNIIGTIFKEVFENGQELFASHPGASVRACRLKRLTYSLYKDSYLENPYKGISNYRNRIPKSQKVY